jgi:A1 cistron-splicing factor AAR2
MDPWSERAAVQRRSGIRAVDPAAIVLLLSLPPDTLVGIDLLSFDSAPRFLGIANVPPGWHFLFTGATASLSVRHGTWFYVPEDTSPGLKSASGLSQGPENYPLLMLEWSQAREELVYVADAAEIGRWQRRLAQGDEELRKGLFPYRQPAGPSGFSQLTSHVSVGVPTRLAGSSDPADWTFTSASCAAQDRDEIPGISTEEAKAGKFGEEEKELNFLGIDLVRTWRPGAVGRERTEGARDRSWALNDIVNRSAATDQGSEGGWGRELLGEMEVCFLMVLTLGNYSCMEEWKRILGLVLTCREIVKTQQPFFASFLSILLAQLKHCDDVEGGLFDVRDDGGGYLKKLLRGFKRILSDIFAAGGGEDVNEEMEELEAWLQGHWAWDLDGSFVRRGIIELEDGERVELEVDDLEAEEERGEYAPVVVDLG